MGKHKNEWLKYSVNNTKMPPDGLSGNEDCGQMSAWYVLSSMGFYSVTPGMDYYSIGTPHFEQVSLNLENGQTFTIKAKELSDANIYIQSVTLNGHPYNKSFINHADIMKGGVLIFEMGQQPNTDWGKGKDHYPIASISASDKITPAPYFLTSKQVFTDSLAIEINNICDDCTIYYKTADTDFIKYDAPFTIFETTDLEAYASQNDKKSFSIHAFYSKIKGGRSIELKEKYNNQYAASGDNALIDFLKGSNNYRTGYWQGFHGIDLHAIVDLGNIQDINSIALGALQDIKSWIWFPESVKISVSSDKVNFEEIALIENDFSDREEGAFIKKITKELKTPIQARYVKVEAKNRGVCPPWHLGAGGQTWIFVDEIWIE